LLSASESKKLIINSNGKCLGTIGQELKREDENTELIINADIAIKQNPVDQKLNLFFHSAFNPLNQMVAAVLRLKKQDSEIVLALLNVNPVELSINISDSNKNFFKRNFSLPGPFILESSNNQLVITHRPSGKSAPFDIAPHIFSLLDLKLIDNPTNLEACLKQPEAILDVETELAKLSQRLETLLPQISSGDFGFLLPGVTP
jgi:hypothetical protein